MYVCVDAKYAFKGRPFLFMLQSGVRVRATNLRVDVASACLRVRVGVCRLTVVHTFDVKQGRILC